MNECPYECICFVRRKINIHTKEWHAATKPEKSVDYHRRRRGVIVYTLCPRVSRQKLKKKHSVEILFPITIGVVDTGAAPLIVHICKIFFNTFEIVLNHRPPCL